MLDDELEMGLPDDELAEYTFADAREDSPTKVDSQQFSDWADF